MPSFLQVRQQNVNVIHVELVLQLSSSLTSNFVQKKGASMVTIIGIIYVPREVIMSMKIIPFRYDKIIVHNRYLKSIMNQLSLG